MIEHPTQSEINAIAHFVEAVRELRHSPFFIEEHRSLRIEMRKGKIKGVFPDPNIQSRILIPFRRVWQQREVCYYQKVINILKKYIPAIRGVFDVLAPDARRTSIMQIQMPNSTNTPLLPSDIIDIWLNTHYMHVGKAPNCGRFTREYFDLLNNQIGPVFFEFYFLSAVQEFSCWFFNIQTYAESFLTTLTEYGLKPSFLFGSAEQDKNIERWTPGFTPKRKTTPTKKVWRLRRRNHYDGFNNFLDLIGVSNTATANHLHTCDSFDKFVEHCDVVLKNTNEIGLTEQTNYTRIQGCFDNHPTVMQNLRCRKGVIAKQKNGTLVWSEEYVPVLRDQYIEFRNAFNAKPFK